MPERIVDGVHKSLSAVFGRDLDYLVDMRENLRGYSWGQDRSMRLMDDIIDFVPEEDDDRFDLGLVIITKANKGDLSDLQKEAVEGLSDCHWYHAHDGQQRLTSIYILLIALLHVFQERMESGMVTRKSKTKVGQRIEDLMSAVNPKTRSGGRVPRIVSNVPSLTQHVDFVNAGDDDEDLKPPAAKKPRTTREPETKDDDANDDDANDDDEDDDPEETKKVQTTYEDYKKALDGMNLDELDKLCYKVLDSTSILVCHVSTVKVAQRMVMNQRHSLNIEDVDYCKGILCRNENCNDPKAVQRKTYKRWNRVYRVTSRKAVHLAAMMVAQIEMGQPLRDTEGKLAVDFFERFVNHRMKRSESCKDIFDRIEASAWKLHHLGNVAKPSDGESDIPGLYKDMDGPVKAKIMPSIRFLVGIIGAPKTAAGKSVEVALLAVLLQVSCPKRLASLLWHLECIALWMVLVPASSTYRARSDRVFSFIKQIKCTSESDDAALSLTDEEKALVRNALEKADVFSNENPKNKIPKVILERVNVFVKQEQQPEFVVEDEVFLETMQPVQNKSKYRLANYVVTTTKPARNRSAIIDKKGRCYNSPFPLSQKAATNLTWEDSKDPEKNSEEIMKAADKHWKLLREKGSPRTASTAALRTG